MSRTATAAVRLIARTLPLTVRDRHREEWLADVEAASENGIRPVSIVIAAATFSLFLDRGLPEIAGYQPAELARRHAQWALVIAGLTVLVVQSRLILAPNDAWLPLALGMSVLTLCHLWSAARLSRGSGRVAAIFSTAGLAALAAAATVPIVVSDAVPGSRYLPILATGCLVVGFSSGLVAWARPIGRFGVAVMTLGATLIFTLAAGILPPSPLFSPTPLTILGLTVVAIVAFARTRNVASAGAIRRARTVTALLGATALGAIGYQVVVSLLLNPVGKAPGFSLNEIYSALPDATLATAIGDILIVGVISVITVVVYLGLMLRAANRGIGDPRRAVAAGSALIALVLVANSTAALMLTLALNWRFGLRPALFTSDLSVALMYAALAIAVVALIAPRAARSPEVPSVPTPA